MKRFEQNSRILGGLFAMWSQVPQNQKVDANRVAQMTSLGRILPTTALEPASLRLPQSLLLLLCASHLLPLRVPSPVPLALP